MSSSGPPSVDPSPVERRTGDALVASGITPNPVLGRNPELARIDALLAAAAGGTTSALRIEGEPGIGKSTLLAAARQRADGFRCLSTVGAESEAPLAYGGLLGLLRPLRDLAGALPEAQADALAAAFGWSAAGSSADRFLIGAATLSVLAAAAERSPVLVLVDDAQWLDSESASAIGFAARRLGPDAVAFLVATRADSPSSGLTEGMPALRLGGLTAGETDGLLPHDLSAAVREHLVAGTAGNPLALREVAGVLDAAQRVGAAPLPSPLPVGDRLLSIYRDTLGALSPDARQAVLLVTLAGTAASAAVSTVLTDARVDVGAALDEATARGVLVLDGGRCRLRHPLLRTAVLDATPAVRQREAHAALAEALPADEPAALWHRAEATVGTDPDLAARLAALADADRDRLGYAAASAALERAALLTVDPAQAATWLARATHDAFQAGDVDRVRGLADRVRASGAPDAARGEVLFTLGMLEQYAGSVPLAVDHLNFASDLLRGVQQVRALTELAISLFRLNDLAGMSACAQRINAVADPSDPEQALLAAFAVGTTLVLSGDFEGGAARLAEVRRLADTLALRHEARTLLLMALAAGFTGQVREAVEVGAARLAEVRRRGALGVLVPTLAILAGGRAWLGDHVGAFADAGEAADLAEHLGYAADASVAVEMLAWQQAARGLHDDARASLDRARVLTDRAGTTAAAAHQALTAAFCALCRGDLAGVVAELEPRLTVDGGVGASGEPLGVAPLLVEAYVGLGRLDDARALTVRYAAVTPAESPPLSTALLGRCRLLIAEDYDQAERAFATAMQAHELGQDPFEAARTRLLHGSRLRRAGQRVAAREQLDSARSAFADMDLTLWAGLADQELAATGATRRRPTDGDQPLTSQETRVALLASQGLSNREIGAALFLSPKTVERHLGSVFRKRGYRSRTELAAAFARAR